MHPRSFFWEGDANDHKRTAATDVCLLFRPISGETGYTCTTVNTGERRVKVSVGQTMKRFDSPIRPGETRRINRWAGPFQTLTKLDVKKRPSVSGLVILFASGASL